MPSLSGHYQYNPIKTVKSNVVGTLNMLVLARRVGARGADATGLAADDRASRRVGAYRPLFAERLQRLAEKKARHRRAYTEADSWTDRPAV